MILKIIKLSKWLISVFLLWATYLLLTIFHFPPGNLSDGADVAIVLGAAVHITKPSPVFEERIKHAINLYHAGKVSKLVFTGGTGKKDEHAESIIARDYAISKKVNAIDIYVETQSLTTRENLVYAQKEILRHEKQASTILLISDPLHLKRAMLMAKDLNLNVNASATPTSRYQSLKTKLPFALREFYFYHHYLLFGQ